MCGLCLAGVFSPGIDILLQSPARAAGPPVKKKHRPAPAAMSVVADTAATPLAAEIKSDIEVEALVSYMPSTVMASLLDIAEDKRSVFPQSCG